MTPTDTLFDSLGIPGQVVVDNQRAELKVDALSGGFRGNHDAGMVMEVFDEGRAAIDIAETRNTPRPCVILAPLFDDPA